MANYWGRSGAPMIQPTKDELREIIADQREALADQGAKLISLLIENLALKNRVTLAEKLLDKKLLDGELRDDVEHRIQQSRASVGSSR